MNFPQVRNNTIKKLKSVKDLKSSSYKLKICTYEDKIFKLIICLEIKGFSKYSWKFRDQSISPNFSKIWNSNIRYGNEQHNATKRQCRTSQLRSIN